MNWSRKKVRCLGAVWRGSIGCRSFHAAGAKYVIPHQDLPDMSTQIKYHVSRVYTLIALEVKFAFCGRVTEGRVRSCGV
jgi:hypothetical protein